VVLLGVFAAGVGTDLGLKRWAFQTVAEDPIVLDAEVIEHPYWQIPEHRPVVVIPRLLNLHLVKNEGAVFGIGANQRVFFIAFTIAALAGALVVFGRWTTQRATLAHIAIALILAGGLGNLYDRIRFGFVRDFLHMLPGLNLPFGWNWPGGSTEIFPWVFNVADVMLLMGMGTLMWYMNSLEKERKARQEARESATKDGDAATRPESATP
jgi:signal peptidase II